MAHFQMSHSSYESNFLITVPDATARSQQGKTLDGRCGVKRGRDVVFQDAALKSIARPIGSKPNAVYSFW